MLLSGLLTALTGLFGRVALGIGILVALLVGGRIWLGCHDKNIRVAERKAIMEALEKDAQAKGEEVKKDVAEKKRVLENAAPDELVDYFRTGRLPKRTPNSKGDLPKGAKSASPSG